MKIILGYQNTRSNGEDFALTPYLSGIKYFGIAKVLGIGLSWGWWSFAIMAGLNIPYNDFISFKNFN